MGRSLHFDGELDILSFAGNDASAEFDTFHPLRVIVNFVQEAIIASLGTGGESGWAHASHVSAVAQVASSGVAGRRSKDCAKSNNNLRARMDGYRKVSIPFIEPFIYMVVGLHEGRPRAANEDGHEHRVLWPRGGVDMAPLFSACMYTSTLHRAHLSSELHRT